jgi:hypothetical protein
MNSVIRNGTITTAQSGAERGHPVYTIDVEVPRGASTTIVLKLTEPASSGAPIVLRQPLVQALNARVNEVICR